MLVGNGDGGVVTACYVIFKGVSVNFNSVTWGEGLSIGGLHNLGTATYF